MITEPLSAGAVHVSKTLPFATVADTVPIAAGAVASGAVAAETADNRPLPNWFTADTRN